MTRLTAAFLALFCLSCAATARAADATPVAAVQELYAVAQKSWANPKFPDPVNNAKMRARFFAKSLAAAIKKDSDEAAKRGEVGNLDFDPVSDSQDPQVKDVEVTLTSADAASAKVAVSFTNGGTERNHLDYVLVQEGGRWRIDDIVKPGTDGWSLRAILKGQ